MSSEALINKITLACVLFIALLKSVKILFCSLIMHSCSSPWPCFYLQSEHLQN